MKKIIFLFTVLIPLVSNAQLNIQLSSEYDHVWPNIFISPLTPVADKLGRPYLYVASNEFGLRIYETDPNLNLINTLDTNQLFMKATSVSQRDTLLYVCVGGIFLGSADPPGIVIVNVADPINPVVLDEWIAPGTGHGTGVVRIQGDFAYVGGMPEGLIILNISDPNNISFVSQVTPNIDFPHPANTQGTVNARGMALMDDTLVYLCYDAGGMRVINCADINNPVQIQQFSNPLVDNTGPPAYWNVPRAYNNVVIDDTVAYVAVDYCGLEVWGISDPLNANLLAHWNPHNCPTGQWEDAPTHANELVGQFECDLLFVSSGSSDMMVMDISDPYMPVAVDSFGTELDTTGTWGIDLTDEHIFLTYVYASGFFTPFTSNGPGIKKLSYDKCSANVGELKDEVKPDVYPNPAENMVNISIGESSGEVRIYSIQGQQMLSESIHQELTVETSLWSNGIYLVHVESEGEMYVKKLVVRK